MADSFVHLHVHTVYSLLDGFSNIKKLVKRAKDMNMPALAITDHGTMYGVIEFFNAAQAAGVKPIIGMETYMAARGMKDRDSKLDKKSSHLLLLAENETGYRNLLKIASAAQLDGFYYYPRIDHDFLAEHSEGLICTSGCMSAEIPRALIDENPDEAVRRMNYYYDVFGPDRFYVELQQHNITELVDLNKRLVQLGAKYSAKFVATNDVHYIEAEDAKYQDVLLAIQTGTLLSDPNRMRYESQTFYLRSPQEMSQLFHEIPEALSNTLEIAERCKVDLGFKGYHLPEFPVPEGYNAPTYLQYLCEQGMEQRYGAKKNDTQYRERLEFELGVINTMGFDAYFLIVWDLCRYARENGIWYNTRGSGAGSIVAYTLFITLVDPIHHNLLFERFLNPGRISMPDIDLDFRDDRRSEMLEYCARKYGDDKVAQIITFGTMAARGALRDVARVMDIPLPEVDKVAKLVPNVPGKPVSLSEALETIPDLKAAYEADETIKELIETAIHMEGTVRNAGTHAAGVVISDKPLTEYLPLHRPTSGAEETPIKTVTQFEMGILDSMGMLKVDFLGLSTLTVMARACDLIKARHNITYDLNNIPTDDPETFKLMGRGQTAGIFQLEGTGMTRWVIEMKPRNLDNIIAMVALYRPGPMDFIPSYIRRMNGEEPIEYRHPSLEPIFSDTYGIPVYQEQIMRAAVDIAGFSRSESDDLRKAISKKLADKIAKNKEMFIKGASERVMDVATATAIFEDWEQFARYGFNKCLPGDVEVLDADTGRVARIEDLYSGKTAILHTVSCDIGSLKLQAGAVNRVMDNGIKPVYRLTTALGRVIEATQNHPFYSVEGWRMLGELSTGDMIATPRCLPVNGNQIWPDHEVIVLGHLLAEGNLCHPHSVYYYNQDETQVQDFVQAAEQFDNVHCSVAMHKGTYSIYAARADRSQEPGVFAWARNLGILGKTAREKEIPPAVFELNNRQIGLLLSRMWQGDGHIDLRGRSLFYATASERLARQVQHLLLRLKIISRLRRVEFPYKDGRTGWQVFVTGAENLGNFYEAIGSFFSVGKKRTDLEELIQLQPVRVMGTKDIVPMNIKGLIRSAKERANITWLELNVVSGIAQREFYPTHTSTKRGFTRQTIGRLADYFDDPDLQRYANNDIYWDEITSIEYVGEKQTYDLEISEHHNFIANDIIVHNSHAADYGLISVQTAFLKAHYTAEYMTALMSVFKNDSDKVSFYVSDTRAMGIDVLPPDVNYSGYDFTIENRTNDKGESQPAIRFGMGAVKNVGQGPVDIIMEARKDGPFRDLNDFTRRADLRSAGKRAIESLIKVGALDSFGSRPALLQTLDRIIAASASHFRAADAGQMSLFGGSTGVADQSIILPANANVDRKELLNWERELLGLYISDHPLSPYAEILTKAVSYNAATLPEAPHEERVHMAGLITVARPYKTKTDKMMGFVTIEDMQGTIELVLFPRTWDKYRAVCEEGKLIIVEGKVDASSQPPKILVDEVRTELTYYQSVGSAPQPANGNGNGASSASQTGPVKRAYAPAIPVERTLAPLPKNTQGAASNVESSPPNVQRSTVNVKTPPADYIDDDDDFANMPPPPEAPPEWEQWAPAGQIHFGVPEAPEPVFFPAEPVRKSEEEPKLVQTVENLKSERLQVETVKSQTASISNPVMAAEPAPIILQPQVEILPPLPAEMEDSHLPHISLPQILAEQPDTSQPPQIITIHLRPSDNAERDRRRIKHLYGILISYPGQDRFSFQIFESGKGYLLDFPNDVTRICPEMLARLKKLIGEESWRIEPLMLQ